MNTKFAISINSTIKNALETINNNLKGAVAVVDADGHLVRMLTDGDIRRALLKGFELASSISSLEFNAPPVFMKTTDDFQKGLDLMDSKSVSQIVILDTSGHVDSIVDRKDLQRILLSVPHMGEGELKFVGDAFASNWIAPLGPNVDGFEKEISEIVNCKHAAALSSGTAALHLSLVLLGVKPNDVVLCSSLTFAASANPIMYQHATPVFVDSELDTWNMSPVALKAALESLRARGVKPKAIIVVNLYGQSADMDPLVALSEEYGVPIIEDAAESLGATYKGKNSGTFGLLGVYSFNGNKIITTSGGGMLVSDNQELIEKARFLATQARDPAPYYQHTEVGYNYRMSNVLAGIGRGQLQVLSDRVEARRAIFARYEAQLSEFNGLEWMPEPQGYYSNRWLSTALLNPSKCKISVTDFIERLNKRNIEARHVWKPMHLQPLYEKCEYFSHGDFSVSDYLFENGVCLPSASQLSESEQDRVIEVIRQIMEENA